MAAARRDLAPLLSRGSLAASFGRESFTALIERFPADAALARSPAVVAYAIRWFELGRAGWMPRWPAGDVPGDTHPGPA